MKVKKTNKKKVPYFKSYKFMCDLQIILKIIVYGTYPIIGVCFALFIFFYENKTFIKALLIFMGIYLFIIAVIGIISSKLKIPIW